MMVTICRRCESRVPGELWHGPACKCVRPDFVEVDTRFSIKAQMDGATVGLVKDGKEVK